MMDELLIGGASIYILLLFILTIVWIFLPFAIFGTKKRLDQIIEETSKTNRLLEEVLDKSGDEQGFSAPRQPHSPRLE